MTTSLVGSAGSGPTVIVFAAASPVTTVTAVVVFPVTSANVNDPRPCVPTDSRVPDTLRLQARPFGRPYPNLAQVPVPVAPAGGVYSYTPPRPAAKSSVFPPVVPLGGRIDGRQGDDFRTQAADEGPVGGQGRHPGGGAERGDQAGADVLPGLAGVGAGVHVGEVRAAAGRVHVGRNQDRHPPPVVRVHGDRRDPARRRRGERPEGEPAADPAGRTPGRTRSRRKPDGCTRPRSAGRRTARP